MNFKLKPSINVEALLISPTLFFHLRNRTACQLPLLGVGKGPAVRTELAGWKAASEAAIKKCKKHK